MTKAPQTIQCMRRRLRHPPVGRVQGRQSGDAIARFAAAHRDMTRKPARKRKTPTRGKAKGVRAASPKERIPITREIFEQFMDHLPAATFIKDAEGRTLYFNRFMREVFGADESWIGRRADEMWPGEVGETMRRDDDEARRRGFQEREEAVPGADGTARDYRTQKFVIPGKGGQPLLAGIALDISRRKAALRTLETSEATLRQSEERFRVMFENAPFGVALVDADGRPVLVNRALEDMLGYSAEQLKRMRFTDFTHPDDARADEDLFHQVLRGERESYRIEKRYIRRDGEIVWGSLGVVGIRDREGKLTHVMGMVEDISQRKRVERELRDIEARMIQAQKLESLGALAGGIAHDFNNLLMAIVGHAEEILEEMPRESGLLAAAREIEIASRRGAELCRQMLAYAGRAKPVAEVADPNAIVAETLRLLEASATRGIDVTQCLAGEVPAVRLPEAQMRQIVMHLVTNAAEAVAGGGRIVVTTGVRRCDRAFLAGSFIDDGLAEGEYVFLEVSDTGAGMDEATKARLFDPFFTTKFAGRGLGLASVLGIVRGGGGAVRVESAPRRGSTFTVLLPTTVRALAPGGPPARPTPEWRGNGTVLVIDDEAGVRTVTARHLERSGFEVLTAETGQRGLELLGQHANVGLVILDLAMPMMSGEECFSRMRAMRPSVPVIMASGYDEASVTQRMRGAAISGFLQKPFKRWELLAVVRRILGDEVVPAETAASRALLSPTDS